MCRCISRFINHRTANVRSRLYCRELSGHRSFARGFTAASFAQVLPPCRYAPELAKPNPHHRETLPTSLTNNRDSTASLHREQKLTPWRKLSIYHPPMFFVSEWGGVQRPAPCPLPPPRSIFLLKSCRKWTSSKSDPRLIKDKYGAGITRPVFFHAATCLLIRKRHGKLLIACRTQQPFNNAKPAIKGNGL